MSTTVIPGTDTEKRDKLIPGDEKTPATETGGAGSKGPIEWLIDDALVSREDDDPFHILLLDETFVKNSKKITIEYVASPAPTSYKCHTTKQQNWQPTPRRRASHA